MVKNARLGKNLCCRWWLSTNLYLALRDREKTTAAEAGLVARYQVAPNKSR